MKFNLSKLSLTILAIVTLAACGSRGSGSNDQPSDQVKPTEQVKPTKQVKPAESVKPTEPVKPAEQPKPVEQPKSEEQMILSRVGFEVNKDTRVVTTIERQIHDDNNVNLVNVEGHEIEIIPSGYYERPVIGTNEKEVLQADYPELRSISGKNYKNIRWGKFTEPALGSDYYVAFGVNPTTEMPQSGTANYTGNGMHIEKRVDDLNSYLSFVKLTTNFADKTLNGTISLANTGYKDVLVSNGIAGGALSPEIHFDDVSLSAKIQGNQFSGTNSQGVQVEGGFYGKDADEVAGTYQGNDKFGVFGARKN
ncbi:transferrin-binding protein-like solute binding protein [Haemophilus parainfluenzae]|uniref:transferrin-binding protein-like solute binding protein n=1 Tax=Haemophilus parainfluenzae TaxID=729 RepID=UPI00223F4AEF|nr:transferrin-binding protein-like solute binding protein [Haemophilus parainfluenzae]